MKYQSNIKRQFAQLKVIEYIKHLLAVKGVKHRTELSELLCKEFNFYDHRGVMQRSTCLKALRDLEKEGHISLPAPVRQKRKGKPQRLGREVPHPVNVPSRVGEFTQLTLIQVETKEQMRLWNELIIREHPQGHRPLVGRQIRYLIWSEKGYLGALGVAAAAVKLAARDMWIGWDSDTRRQYLDRVICLNRFLIRPSVHCRNLASFVLGMFLRTIAVDFEHKYGYRPWLVESFVDTSQFRGTCFKASNWICVGHSQGRGRQDRCHNTAETIKDIFIYPLRDDFRDLMGIVSDTLAVPLKITSGVTSAKWAEHEFGRADLGDKRLTKRLVTIADQLAMMPGCTYSMACGGDRASVKGFYRLIDNPDQNAITMETLLASHRHQTIRRMASKNEVLIIHDSSELNYSGLHTCTGLGVIGKNQTKTKTPGLQLHSELATTASGLPLGILKAHCRALQLKPHRRGTDHRYLPIEQKDTYKWVQGLLDSQDIARSLPETALINVMDRDADIFDLFDQWRSNPTVDVLIRAKHNRRTIEDKLLFETIENEPVKARIRLTIPRRGARQKNRKDVKRPKRPARKATLAIRYRKTHICPPSHGVNRKKAPIPIWLIHVYEENPPTKGEDVVNWYLITTVELTKPERAIQCVHYYSLRWRIEDWHRVIKSGCKIEQAAHRTAERLRRFIALNLVVGWRIMLMSLLSRETPQVPPDVLFTEIEIVVLCLLSQKKKLPPPVTIKDAVNIIAHLGGYLGRTGDTPPGNQVLWRGNMIFR